MDKVQKIREVIEKRYEYWKEKESNSHSIESEIRMSECQHLLLMLDSLQKETVSEGLEKEVLHGKRCSKCGDVMKADTSVIYTSNPPMYFYECPNCGNNEYGLCSENY